MLEFLAGAFASSAIRALAGKGKGSVHSIKEGYNAYQEAETLRKTEARERKLQAEAAQRAQRLAEDDERIARVIAAAILASQQAASSPTEATPSPNAPR